MARSLAVALLALALVVPVAQAGVDADARHASGGFAQWTLDPLDSDGRAYVVVDAFRVSSASGTEQRAFVAVLESRCEAGETITRRFAGEAPATFEASPVLAGAALVADVVVEGIETRFPRCDEGPIEPAGDGPGTLSDEEPPPGASLGLFALHVEVDWSGEGVHDVWAWPNAGRYPPGCAYADAYADLFRSASAQGTVTGSLPLVRNDLADVAATDFAAIYSGTRALAEGCLR